MENMQELIAIMAKLRDPETGCPWDLKQSFKTIAPYTIEEAYEVSDAIERDDMQDLREELGDLLLQVVFHAQMASEQNHFTFSDVVDTLAEKLVRRHPHVFSSTTVDNDEQLNSLWEAEKTRERESKTQSKETSVLDGLTASLPALMRSVKIQKKVARVGFDWTTLKPVIEKVHEELAEVEEAIRDFGEKEQEEELGDLLFAVSNLSRHMKFDAESALAKANNKFVRRFKRVEAEVARQGRRVEDVSLEELEEIWQAIKKQS